ncbi:hypothetical protein MBLNU230_g6368t1 [Neophaeotheca triangularis]
MQIHCAAKVPGALPLMKLPWELRSRVLRHALASNDFMPHPSVSNRLLYDMHKSSYDVRNEALYVFRKYSTLLLELHSRKPFRVYVNGVKVTWENHLDGRVELRDAFRHEQHVRRFLHVHVVADPPPHDDVAALLAHWKTIALNAYFLLDDVMRYDACGVPKVSLTLDLALGTAIEPALAHPDTALVNASKSFVRRWQALTVFRKKRNLLPEKEDTELQCLSRVEWIPVTPGHWRKPKSEQWHELYPSDEGKAMALLCDVVTDLVIASGGVAEVMRYGRDLWRKKGRSNAPYSGRSGLERSGCHYFVPVGLEQFVNLEEKLSKIVWPLRQGDDVRDIRDLCEAVGALPEEGDLRLIA